MGFCAIVVIQSALLFTAAPSCSSSNGGDASPIFDAQTTEANASGDAADAAPFSMAGHTPFPSVTRGSGPVLAHLHLITITFADHPNITEIDSFGDWVTTSTWLSNVGNDYGVGPGTHTQVVLPKSATGMFTDSDVQALLATNISNGTIPTNGDGGTEDFLYMIFFSPGVSITIPAVQGGTSVCQLGAAGGYHWEATNPKVPYAVIPACMGETIQEIETTASHELIETATDPFDQTSLAWAISDANNPWAGGGGEVADLCEGQTTTADGFEVTRVWSNSAAATQTEDPCVPAPAGPFFDTAVSTSKAEPVTPGKQITLSVEGFSTAPIPAWGIAVFVVPALSNFDPKPALGADTIENGATTTLTLQIPAGTPSQNLATVLVYSTAPSADPKFWPVVIYAP